MTDRPVISDELLRRLPLPLAQLYRRAHNAKSHRDAHDCGVYFWEAALKLLASTAIVTASAEGPPPPAIAERLRNLARPSLGHWREFIRVLVPRLSHHAGFREIAEALDGPRAEFKNCLLLDSALRTALGQTGSMRQNLYVGELFDRLVEYRNRNLAHAAPAARIGAGFRPIADLLLAAAAELFGRIDVLAGQRLIAVTEVRPDRGRWIVERIEMHGVVPWRITSLELPRIVGAGSPLTEGVYLGDPARTEDVKALVPLHPLIVFDPEAETALFLNSRRGRRRVELLCYATGRTVELSDAGVVPSEVLARILGVPVSKADAESWAAASQSEEPETSLAAPPSSGRRRLGDFEVVGELGRGAMGVVYKAWQPALSRMVALKVQPRPGDEKADARFRREVRALARVDHPHLVKVYSSGYDGEQFFYAMELIEGAPLAAVCDALTRDGAATTAVDLTEWKAALGAAQHPSASPPTATSEPAPKSLAAPTVVGEVTPLATLVDDRHPTGGRSYLRRIVRLLQQVSEAAHALHEAGVLHRDIKPGNVLVTADGEQAVLMDLGLAQLADDTEGRLTRTRQFVGTLRYASPQQVMAVGTLDRRSDVYSLGATLWELLTLRPLFGATENTPTPELMERIQRDEPQRLGRVNPEGGRDLEAVVHKCLEKDPDHRYSSARELAEDLGRWLDGEPVVARPVRGWERAAKWMRRRPILAGLSAALVIALLYASVSSWILLGRVQREAETARAQRDDAEAQRRRMQATLDDMLSEESLAYLTTQKELLPEQRAFLERAVKYYTEFAQHAPTDIEGRRLVATALTRVARIHQSLGRAADAERSFHAALAAHQELARIDSGHLEFQRAVGADHNNLARLLADHSRAPEAEAEYRSAIEAQSRLVQIAAANPDFRRDLAESRSNFGHLLDDLNRLPEADTELRAALELQKELYAADSADLDIRRSLARTYVHLCHLLIGLRKPEEAVAEMRSALALQEQIVAEARASAEDRGALATSYQGLGILLNTLGRRQESDEANRKSLAIRERLAADYPGVPIHAVDLGVSYYNLGEQAFNRGDTPAARDSYSKAIAVLEPMFRTHPAHTTLREALCYAHWGMALALDKAGRGADALAEWDRSVELAENRLQTALRLGRAGTQARSGDSQKARAVVDGLTQATGLEPDVLYEIARVWALIGANSPPPDGERGSIRAVAALQTAFAKGFAEFERVLTDPDLASLRGRDDFAALLWAWADAPMPAPTSAVSAH